MKLLYITSLSGRRVNGFMRSAIIAAKNVGLDFVMACNTDDADKDGYRKDCEKYGIRLEHIDFDRNPLSPKNKTAYSQLLDLMCREHFDIIQCNTPIGGLLGRLCAKKCKLTNVIYMAHGFHFWNGAPLKNWILYYPVERVLAHYTDRLITINKEDLKRAQHFKLRKNGRLIFIHGVGVDISKFSSTSVADKRYELKIPEEAKIYISVGEMIERKNQTFMIEAFHDANLQNAHLIICGDGELRGRIEDMVASNKMKNVHVLGFRQDIPELLSVADVFVFPSFQEGLPGALMEAMASGKVCVASKIRGNTDLLGEDYKYLFAPSNKAELIQKFREVHEDCSDYSTDMKNRVKPYGLDSVIKEFEALYSEFTIADNTQASSSL